jgi:hypothetical protein
MSKIFANTENGNSVEIHETFYDAYKNHCFYERVYFPLPIPSFQERYSKEFVAQLLKSF